MSTPYNILAINPGHNGSCAFVSDGKIMYYAEEERWSRSKYDGNPFRAMLNVLTQYSIDELVLGGTSPEFSRLPWTMEDAYTALVRKYNPRLRVTNQGEQHHLGHAAAAFYGSGFETAVAIIVDGAGSLHADKNSEDRTFAGYETESIYRCSYPHTFDPVYKRYSGQPGYYNNGVQEWDDSVTITKAYEAVSEYLGFGYIEAGKTMGLAPYGKPDDNIPDFFVQGRGNKNLLIPRYPAGANLDEVRFPYIKRAQDQKQWHTDFNKCRDIDKNLAWAVQNQCEQMMYDLIQRAVDQTEERNVVLSGGFALNCVANYRYLKRFPGLKFYIDPIAHDGGTALGLARHAWYKHSKEQMAQPVRSVYLGALPDYNYLTRAQDQVPDLQIQDVIPSMVAAHLAAGKIIALFQGQAEGGPRALGNRSILFDPRVQNGKDIVNSVKQREWFRPFAASVLEEHATEWFDMAGLSSSPFMMYAVDVLPDQASLIPAVCHVDQTCRVQTVNPEQNAAFYELIKEFKALTGVPLLLNTSFNLAGHPLVESLFDALWTLLNSGIHYLYLPELGKLISKPVPSA